jgi:hypothetical protein
MSLLCSEIIADCSEIHTKHINTLCGQNVQFLYVKPDGTYSDHWALQSSLYYTQHIQFDTRAVVGNILTLYLLLYPL